MAAWLLVWGPCPHAPGLRLFRIAIPARGDTRPPPPAWSKSDIKSGSLNHPIEQRLATLEALEIVDEVLNESLGLRVMATRAVRRDIAIRRRPERMIGRQRLRIGHIEISRS